MTETDLFFKLGISLAIGFLVGLQREFSFKNDSKDRGAGIRTFPILAMIGTSGAFLADKFETPIIFAFCMLIPGLMFALNYYIEAQKKETGLTTEMSGLLIIIIGGLVYLGQESVAAALGVITTVLLSAKQELHRFAHKLTRSDMTASLKFAVISLIVLPLLPEQNFGPEPYNIFNPFKIWLLVVFISGISFVGFILIKFFGASRGIGITGFLGGIASSTAVTLSFTARSRDNDKLAPAFSMAIIVAWTIMFARVVVEVAVLNKALLGSITPALAVMASAGLLYSFFLIRRQVQEPMQRGVDFSNPFELGPAIKFGLIFMVVLLVSKVAQHYFGDTGVLVSSFVSGLADVDAIALSVADLSARGEMSNEVAADAVVIAAIANTLAKGAIVFGMGTKKLVRAILPGFLMMLAAGVAGVFIF